ncbi:MAG: DMT family transporter [Rhodobacteraceae bacterium]|nr:DMT family transporter [Paracoccaceae bacterium]
MNNASDNLRGAVFMMLSMAGYVINDTLIKLVTADIPLAQSVFIRGLVASALLAGFAAYKGQLFYRAPRGELKIILWRAFAEISATYCFLTALINMPLANVTAILQALPLAVTLAGSLFLGHKVGWRRYLAILVGFGGVLIIIRPGGADFNSFALWAVAAVGFITLRDVMAVKLRPDTPSMFVALFTAVGVTGAAGIAALFEPWVPVSATSFSYLFAAAGFILIGYITSISAMRYGEIAFVSPFRYTVLVWALLLGIFVFKDYPDFWTMTGIGVVVGTGVFTFYREQRGKAKAG